MNKNLMYDVVVIGGGPAGMAAAIESYNQGAKTLLIERNEKLGGILNQCIHNGFGLQYFNEELTGPEYALRFVELLSKTKVDVLLNTFVIDINGLNVTIINEKGQTVVQAKAIVLAMGCREKTPAGIMLTGSRPVGVYTAGQVQKMVNIHGKLPGKNCVILGSGDIGLIMARRLTYEGAKVLEVLEIMPESGGLKRNIVQCLNDNNIPLKLKHTVTRVIGNTRIEGVYVAEVDGFTPKLQTEKFVKCDCLILSVGLIPEVDLVKNLKLNPKTGGADVNEFRETNIEGIFSCGNVLHVHDLVDNVTYESKLAGTNAAKYALGKLTHKKPFNVVAGNGIRYVSPSFGYMSEKEDLMIYFRLSSRITKSYICVKCGENEIYSKFVLAANAGEMQKIQIEKSKINGDLTVLVRGQ